MDGLIIDSFAGGGGASTGIEWALGRSPDIALNHDAEAIAMHMANHPTTRHYCQNIWQADPDDVVREAGGGPVDLLWASPDCKHFSKAKGAAPVKRNIRDLAWVVVLWAQRVRPKMIALENVEEFQTWGPLIGDKPDPAQKGVTFLKWVRELRKIGYLVEWRELRACDYGAPTIRKRLFVLARCDGQPIVWPDPTHGAPDDPDVTAGRKLPWRTAAEIIDWSLPCPSIFERSRPLAENTMKRIARGLKKFVFEADSPFIVTCNHGGDWFRGQGLDRPVNTVTAARDAHGLVVPTIARIGQTGGGGGYAYGVEQPLTTITSKNEHILVASHVSRQFGQGTGRGVDGPLPTVTADGGGKSALVSAFLAKHFGGVTGVPVDKPAPTVTTRGTQTQLVTSHLLKMKGTCRHGQAVTAPMPTVQAGGLHVAEVRAFLMKYYGEGGQLSGIDAPLATLTTKHRMGLITIAGEDYQIHDIGMRMLSPRELFRAQGFPDSYIIDPEFNGKPLSKTSQVAKCGNSVCPVMSEALIGANLPQHQATRAVA